MVLQDLLGHEDPKETKDFLLLDRKESMELRELTEQKVRRENEDTPELVDFLEILWAEFRGRLELLECLESLELLEETEYLEFLVSAEKKETSVEDVRTVCQD
ncbi:hypothetical protein G9C98_005245 [Cotesia typhae]|uniref:Uncharacterized protein n=1 Tax=Cotesia typhae TaxID=2053667 RepID=A0A8J5R0K9_9HYME|nr:hypothetical protein G9C98_005245 [Cotesia typhae]